jgi:hypothetical protein
MLLGSTPCFSMTAASSSSFFLVLTVFHARSASIEQHHLAAGHALAEVLVGAADQHLRDLGVLDQLESGTRQRVVGFELHHRPRDHAQRFGDLLGQRKLGQKQRVDAIAALVAVEHLVAKRLDHVIEGNRHVGRALLLDQRGQRGDQRARGADLGAVWRGGARRAVVHAKKLVGAVDQMNPWHVNRGCFSHARYATRSTCTSHRARRRCAPRPRRPRGPN